MWKWLLLGVVGFLAWKWYKAGFVQIQDNSDTFNVKVRKLSGLLGALDPISKKDNINFGTVEAPRPNVDPGKGYFRALSGIAANLPDNPTGNGTIGTAFWRL